MKITTEQILEHAEIAATYFRTLVAKGIPVDSACSLTGNYVISIVLREARDEPPREPWQDGPG